jgi:hypothetical protein
MEIGESVFVSVLLHFTTQELARKIRAVQGMKRRVAA